jgi:hypothetical protein
MVKVDGRKTLHLEVVLDDVFRSVPHGGDHESRKRVAKKLVQSAKKGNVTLDGLRVVGREALRHLSAGDGAPNGPGLSYPQSLMRMPIKNDHADAVQFCRQNEPHHSTLRRP